MGNETIPLTLAYPLSAFALLGLGIGAVILMGKWTTLSRRGAAMLMAAFTTWWWPIAALLLLAIWEGKFKVAWAVGGMTVLLCIGGAAGALFAHVRRCDPFGSSLTGAVIVLMLGAAPLAAWAFR